MANTRESDIDAPVAGNCPPADAGDTGWVTTGTALVGVTEVGVTVVGVTVVGVTVVGVTVVGVGSPPVNTTPGDPAGPNDQPCGSGSGELWDWPLTPSTPGVPSTPS